MKQIDLTLEIPAHDPAEDFPDADALSRAGAVGRALGLDGEQVLQLTVVVNGVTLPVLQTWLMARAKRSKYARVVWNGQVFSGYTSREIARLIRSLKRDLDDKGGGDVDR